VQEVFSVLIRDIANSPHERVIDRSVLCELLHPDKVPGAGDLGCSIAHAIVPVGEETLPHRLRESTELYYILSGCGEMVIDSGHAPVREGQVVLIPPGARQYIRNTGDTDLVFLAIVAPKWRADDEVLA
jgi:mannose-6-phosphate isomerase-like protein (cupin superfamily)